MSTGYYLLDNPNPNAKPRPDGRYWGRYKRRQKLRVVIIHSAENQPDFTPPDNGAEAVARYGAAIKRPASYHTVVDSDTIIPLLPPDHESYNCRYGANAFSWGVSMATRADSWDEVPTEWREAIGLNLMRVCAIISEQYGIPPVKLTREQAFSGASGYIDHATMDPWRRHDPGWGDHEWTVFLEGLSEMLDDTPDPPPDPTPGTTGYAVADGQDQYGRTAYWTVDRTGKVSAWNGAPHQGDLTTIGVQPKGPIIDIVSPDGVGYWLIGADGGVFAFGGIPYPDKHPEFMVDVAPNLLGDIRAGGYLRGKLVLMASDHGTFAFGV